MKPQRQCILSVIAFVGTIAKCRPVVGTSSRKASRCSRGWQGISFGTVVQWHSATVFGMFAPPRAGTEVSGPVLAGAVGTVHGCADLRGRGGQQ